MYAPSEHSAFAALFPGRRRRCLFFDFFFGESGLRYWHFYSKVPYPVRDRYKKGSSPRDRDEEEFLIGVKVSPRFGPSVDRAPPKKPDPKLSGTNHSKGWVAPISFFDREPYYPVC